jgi:hypothetical protein
MFRKSNSILVKAVAMGALLTSGGIATDRDDNKERKNSDAPMYGSRTNDGFTATRLPPVGTENRDFHRSLVEPTVKNILSEVDKRHEMRRELLMKPIKINLRGDAIRGVQPFDKVVNTLLADAKKYNVLLNLTLLNATETELKDILSHQDAGYIQEFDWTYEVNLIDDISAYDLSEVSDGNTEEWMDDSLTPTSTDDLDEEWIDDSLTFTPTDESDEEWIDDPLTLTGNDFDEEWIDDPAILRGGDPYAGLPRFRRPPVARAMYAPRLPDLVENVGKKGVITPPVRIVDTTGSLDIGKDKVDTSAWNITLVKDAEGQKDPNTQDLGRFNNVTSNVAHNNLVHIFCRENRVQA